MKIWVVGSCAHDYCQEFLRKWNDRYGKVVYIHPPENLVMDSDLAKLMYSVSCMKDEGDIAMSALKNGTAQILLLENWTLVPDFAPYKSLELEDQIKFALCDILNASKFDEPDIFIDAADDSSEFFDSVLEWVDVVRLDVDTLIETLKKTL